MCFTIVVLYMCFTIIVYTCVLLLLFIHVFTIVVLYMCLTIIVYMYGLFHTLMLYSFINRKKIYI